NIRKEDVDFLFFGQTMIQKGSFFGAAGVARRMGMNIPGMAVTHACATSTNAIYMAAAAVELGNFETVYCALMDRLSNGPHIIWPNPLGPGAEVISENVNMDNMNCDPTTGLGMLTTAENVAKECGFTREEADDMTIMRYEQYQKALENDRAFQKKYMIPVKIKVKKEIRMIEADEGITSTSREMLAKLKPVQPGGIHTFGGQTHPADGSSGMIVTTKDKAREYQTEDIPVQVLSYGYSRTKPAFMPAAPADAVRMVLKDAGITLNDVAVFKNHAPFIVNDLHLCKDLGLAWDRVNNYGTSLVFGHPQGPTVCRLLIEGIEEAVLKGGGYVVASGCAAGDCGAAILVKVG
ncbi:MAG: thiolase family protein, partial [Lachnospiraceae bacterium]|nr:thiolase family protein [Lachnospiraceae bacterium]